MAVEAIAVTMLTTIVISAQVAFAVPEIRSIPKLMFLSSRKPSLIARPILVVQRTERWEGSAKMDTNSAVPILSAAKKEPPVFILPRFFNATLIYGPHVEAARVFKHLGPKAQLEPVATCCRLTERVWLKYLELAGNLMPARDSREFLVMKMLYIAEMTSSAIRLNMSWALAHPAMSLFRDRYEQTLRFSWLVRILTRSRSANTIGRSSRRWATWRGAFLPRFALILKNCLDRFQRGRPNRSRKSSGHSSKSGRNSTCVRWEKSATASRLSPMSR